MDSEFDKAHNPSGLLRFRSAPSSFLENFITEGLIKNENYVGTENNKGLPPKFNNQLVSQTSVDSKAMGNSFAALLPPQYPRQNSSTASAGHVVGSVDGGGYRVMGSLGTVNHHQAQNKSMVSNLMRQNSSPAGLFSHLNAQNGYGTLKGGASLGMLSRISEVDNESSITTTNDEKCGDGNSEAQFYNMGYPFTSWNESTQFQETITGHKRELDNEGNKLFANVQIEELGNRPPILSRHVSLPKTPAEIAALDKLLHFQDTIPCKIRAKRGCATHPRSIAERVRRTRISERMRKLQELVPNMDKQTNTSDMLDLAVEYIKDLQNQYKTLSDYRANCKCSAMQNPASNQRV